MTSKTVRTSVDRLDFRRDRRHPVPPVIVRISDREYPTINWSLSGIQVVAQELSLAVDDGMAGTLLMAEAGSSFEFSAVVVWADSEQGIVGARFTELPPGAVEKLDRYLAQWLRRTARR